ncbi:SIS domain-containing protein [Collinsella sp. zg1085]|uniref:SIS domain-containing protein n=1 Tax=Collinsella sp. zg1085 TaxID=2844380 RepID=UPI001C0D83E3|nr:SIS domain-containing protein [Collinsella sp. zg1085]QWT18026.1 SIS domain-containing protein [Collinsella sp. zg1085]
MDTERFTMGDYIDASIELAYNNLHRMPELLEPLLACCTKQLRRICIVASGSSYNAAQIALPFMQACLPNYELRVIPPFSFVHYELSWRNTARDDELILVLSQSGLSTNALEALDALAQAGLPTLCITANPQADVMRHAKTVIDYGAGEELVGYVTKGVCLLSVYLMSFAAVLAHQDERLADIYQALEVADVLRLSSYDFVDAHLLELTNMQVAYVMGAGPTWGVALEGALKIGETVHVPSPSFELEEFIHGPNLQLIPSYHCLFFDPGDTSSKRVTQIWQASSEVTKYAYLLTPHRELAGHTQVLVAPLSFDARCASLVYLPFVQVLSYRVSEARGGTLQHPLLRKFKKVAAAKTEHFINFDMDD